MSTSARRPNILFIMSDDHAAHAISAYGSRLNHTPHIDRLASSGVRCDHTFCTNSICAPSRATILTGTWNHINGVRTLHDRLDGAQDNVAKRLQAAGYQTGIIGKWHLGHGGEADPTGFDHWCVLNGQGLYQDPEFFTPQGRVRHPGYATDVITDLSLSWLKQRDQSKPFFLMLHHKAPHREWEFHPRHAHLYPPGTIPEPATFWDDHQGHARAAQEARMTMFDLDLGDLGATPPAGLSRRDEQRWRYQHYLSRYLRTVQGVDDSVGQMLDWLEAEHLRNDTIVIYTSDQGFFLGDHGWFDKRFMYEESLRMPFLVSWPGGLPQGAVNHDILLNADIAATFLEWAGLPPAPGFQGRSMHDCLRGRTPADWRDGFYYRYWMHKDNIHQVWAHYGLRTRTHKLIHYYADALDANPHENGDVSGETPEWELFDLRKDPFEMSNAWHDPDYAGIRDELTARLHREQTAVGDRRFDPVQATELAQQREVRLRSDNADALGPWRVVGPWVLGRNAIGLESAAACEEDLVHGRPVTLPPGIRDLHAEPRAQGHIDLTSLLGYCEFSLGYGITTWHEPLARDIEFGFGSDDAIVAWLDGQRIHAHDTHRGYRPREDRVRHHLRPGPHRLVIKIINYPGGWGFGAHVMPP